MAELKPLDPVPFIPCGNVRLEAFEAARSKDGLTVAICAKNGVEQAGGTVAIADDEKRAEFAAKLAREIGMPVVDLKAALLQLWPAVEATLRGAKEKRSSTAQPAPPSIELLDDAPLAIARPLCLVDGQAYAAVWAHAKATISQSVASGKIVQHNPPIVETRRELLMVRGDGTLFGPGGDHPLSDLGIEVKLAEPPRDAKLWRTAAVKAYRAGYRPDACDVFGRVKSIYNHFIDFDRSIADQGSMCELSACFSMQTWFVPAFTVVGYPYPNGERGSGKSHWGSCWANTSYLGEVILASGTFAALRDLAEYGGAMLFDDAENLRDKRFDPDKRALLLAGNRRGACVPLKEPAADGTWQTRWVSAFCPRGFTAISLPDNVLGSRSVVLPLARTADAKRGNADPADFKRWPCDQRALQDDLWALALSLLPEAERAWSELDGETDTVGREFEPWRALLAVARLMERQGIEGLEQRIRDVMKAYQAERSSIIGDDWVVQLLRALISLAADAPLSDSKDGRNGSDSNIRGWTVTAKDVSERIKALHLAESDDVECWASPEKVGRLMTRLRFEQQREKGAKRTRNRWIGAATLEATARAYGVEVDEVLRSKLLPKGLDTTVLAVPTVPTVRMSTDSARGQRMVSCTVCGATMEPDGPGDPICLGCYSDMEVEV